MKMVDVSLLCHSGEQKDSFGNYRNLPIRTPRDRPDKLTALR